MSSDDEVTPLSRVVGRRQYLVTYSQANITLFPTREAFGNMLREEFDAGDSKAKVLYWACCQETHKDGGLHYHCSLKLSGSKKWAAVRTRIFRTYGINVNFSSKQNHYLAAYRYVCKEDKHVAHSTAHPIDLLMNESPVTAGAIKASREAAKKRRASVKEHGDVDGTPCSTSSKKSKTKTRFRNSDAGEFVRKHDIHSYTELLAKAEERREAGQNDVLEYVYNRSEKNLRELITKTWQMTKARETIEDDKKTRIQKVQAELEKPCVESCEGQWLQCALQVLGFNGIDQNEFAKALRDLFVYGRGKNRNILIIGPANCAKTFMLKPLKVIFQMPKLFENPATDKYGWVHADKAQVILLNDFRWSRELIQWQDMLNLLEGETVKLPAPQKYVQRRCHHNLRCCNFCHKYL